MTAEPNLVYRSLSEIESIQEDRLRKMLDLCFRGHPYYKKRWRETGIDPQKIRTLGDLDRLPLTSKHEFMTDPDSFRLDVPELPLPERLLWEVMYTTGTTTGRPAVVYTTSHDHFAWLYHAREAAKFDDINSRDVVISVYPLTSTPTGAFVRAPHSAFAVGATCVQAHPGAAYPGFPVHNPIESVVDLVETHRGTILQGVASYIRRLLIRAHEMGADFSSVRLAILGGESASPSLREDVRQRLLELGAKAPRVTSRYGSIEMGIMPECAPGVWHNPTPDLMYMEIVDEGGRRLPDGDKGLLCITHLNARGTVLVRYLIGDITSVERSTCPHCGRQGERITAQPVRTKELVKVKGMLVNPELIKEEMASLRDVREFQVVFTRQDPADPLSMDELLLRVAPAEDADENLADQVAERVKAATSVRPRVVLVEAREIFDPEKTAKPVRILDLR